MQMNVIPMYITFILEGYFTGHHLLICAHIDGVTSLKINTKKLSLFFPVCSHH